MPEKTVGERLAVIETLIEAHNTLCNDRWKRIERAHYAILAFMSALSVGLLIAVIQHYWK